MGSPLNLSRVRRLFLTAEMVSITAVPSQMNLDFQSCSCANVVAATHVAYRYDTAVVMFFIVSAMAKTINQSTHICMNHTKTQKLLRKTDILEAFYLLRRTAVQAQKERLSSSPMGQKHCTWRAFCTSF